MKTVQTFTMQLSLEEDKLSQALRGLQQVSLDSIKQHNFHGWDPWVPNR